MAHKLDRWAEAKWYAQEAWFRKIRDGEVLVMMLSG